MKMFQDGKPVKGFGHDNFCATRVVELCQVKAKKLIMAKSKYELSLICPGEVTESFKEEGKVFANEPRLAVCMNIWTTRITGT